MPWPKGIPTWNKGLTKKSDSRIKDSWSKGHTKATDIRLASGKYGHPVLQAERDKISATLMGRFKGKNSPFFGVPRSDEVKRKISLKNKGRKLTPETRLKMSLSYKKTERINPMLGKKHTEESKIKMSESTKKTYINHPELRIIMGQTAKANNILHPERAIKHSNSMKEKWKDENYSRRVITNWRKACQKEPNKAERKLQLLLDKSCPGEYYYIGDGKLVIGRLNPDFCHKNKKKLVELFGAHWHKLSEIPIRLKRFSEHGYDCLIIWDTELDNEDILIGRIRNFTL